MQINPQINSYTAQPLKSKSPAFKGVEQRDYAIKLLDVLEKKSEKLNLSQKDFIVFLKQEFREIEKKLLASYNEGKTGIEKFFNGVKLKHSNENGSLLGAGRYNPKGTTLFLEKDPKASNGFSDDFAVIGFQDYDSGKSVYRVIATKNAAKSTQTGDAAFNQGEHAMRIKTSFSANDFDFSAPVDIPQAKPLQPKKR